MTKLDFKPLDYGPASMAFASVALFLTFGGVAGMHLPVSGPAVSERLNRLQLVSELWGLLLSTIGLFSHQARRSKVWMGFAMSVSAVVLRIVLREQL